MNFGDITQFILNVGSLSGLIALPYTIVNASKRRPRLKFDFSSKSGIKVVKDDSIREYFSFEFSGTIKNRSTETNSISKIYLVVWANNIKRNSTLRLGFGGEIVESEKDTISLPLELPPKTGKNVNIYFEIPTKGTSDEKLLSEYEPVGNSGKLYLPKHNYELCFEDTDENFFDQQGRLRNLEEINLNWTLPNTVREMQKGNIYPFIKHFWKIQKSRILFVFKKIGYAIGL